MKLAILTLRLNDNYGGLLQAYALQKTLEGMGHCVSVLDEPRKYTLPRGKMLITYGKRLAKKMLGSDVEIFREKRLNREYGIVNRHIVRFVDENINRTEISGLDGLSPDGLDGIVVGSDQIWRPKYCRHGRIERGFLDFAEAWDIKRVAYAASFGTDEWEYNAAQTQRCSELIQKFDRVSVRERSGIWMCEKMLKRADVCQVLDPTLLLNAVDYEKIIDRHHDGTKTGELMVYFLDDDPKKRELAGLISDSLGMTAFAPGAKVKKPVCPAQERVYPPVEAWLGGFRDAKFIVTDSFHGCVFSILFKKPFMAYGNRSRGYARFTSLLSALGLCDRLVSEETEAEKIKEIISQNIDYDAVSTRLAEKREESMAYLRDALDG